MWVGKKMRMTPMGALAGWDGQPQRSDAPQNAHIQLQVSELKAMPWIRVSFGPVTLLAISEEKGRPTSR